jgi:3-hydroxyacyl-[acyl-carrier-protein] dehydratase
MIPTISEEVAELFHRAEKQPLVVERGTTVVLDRAGIERHLPTRDPFLMLDRVTLLDFERPVIVARYDLSRARAVFAGHFPGYPLYPGVLQIETIGQAGIVLDAVRANTSGRFALTHVLAARFLRPVLPGGDLEVISQILEDGLFRTVVGQVLREGQICAVAAVSGVEPAL